MFRDRTNLYLSYRRTFPHSSTHQFSSIDLEDDGLTEQLIELPPTFFDLTSQLDSQLSHIDKQLAAISTLYNKNILPNFAKSNDNKEIEKLNYQITISLGETHHVLKKLAKIKETQVCNGKPLTREDILMLGNMEKKYAQELQTRSSKYRKLSNMYLKYLNDDFKMPVAGRDKLEPDETGEQIESYSQHMLTQVDNHSVLAAREREIADLATSVLEISHIFKEMQNLVIEQGTIVDRIDYNIETARVELKQANKEMDTAERYQKRSQKCKLIMFLSLLVILMVFVVMLKPRHTVSHDVTPSPTLAAPASSVSVVPHLDSAGDLLLSLDDV